MASPGKGSRREEKAQKLETRGVHVQMSVFTVE